MAELIVYDEPERSDPLITEKLIERFGVTSEARDTPDSLDQPYDPDPLKKGDAVTIRRRLECQGYRVEQYGCGGRYMDDLEMDHDGEPDGTEGVVFSTTDGSGLRASIRQERLAKLKGHIYVIEWLDSHKYHRLTRHTRSELDRR